MAMSPEALREREQARRSVLGTAGLAVFFILWYVGGLWNLGALLGTLVFMAGYCLERLRLSRVIISLLDERDRSTAQTGS